MTSMARRTVWLVAAALALGCADAPDPDTSGTESGESTAAPSLVEIMRGLETDMARVAHGVWVADFDSMAAGARAVADHPQVGPDERARILTTLGDGAAGFRQADVQVHDLALVVEEEARAGDMPGVLDALTRLQAGCVTCHTGYRAQLQAAQQDRGA